MLDVDRRWRSSCAHYARWLSEFPEIALVLDNLLADVAGADPGNHNYPEGGPLSLQDLRDKVRTMRPAPSPPWLAQAAQDCTAPIPKWHLRYLRLAREVASWSKDPSTQVGAYLADARNRPLSFGVNGFPQGIPDIPEWLQDRAIKNKVILHAEENAQIFAERSLKGATLYTWPLGPCSRCMSKMIQLEIAQVVTVEVTGERAERWRDDLAFSEELARLAGVSWTIYPAGLVGSDVERS